NAAPDGAHFGAGAGFEFGPAAIGAMAAGFPADVSFTWAPDVVEVAPSGDLAFTTGPVQVREAKPDGTRQAGPPGRYFSIWRRQADGTWKFVIDG
ncbi:MAG TPA: nuclear transport factor 2 family protein, partial [Longimicrobiaceae bacterium]|nr:nuclear transport factor 2 family protein [Longimicrobiaceae bacterium]